MRTFEKRTKKKKKKNGGQVLVSSPFETEDTIQVDLD